MSIVPIFLTDTSCLLCRQDFCIRIQPAREIKVTYFVVCLSIWSSLRVEALHHETQNTTLILFISLLEALSVHYSINTPNWDQTIDMFVEGRGGEGVQCCRLLGNKSMLCHLIFVPANHENKHNMYEVKKLDVLTF